MGVAVGRWLLVSVDLPSRSKSQRQSATRFRNWLVDFGYVRISDALYRRYMPPRMRLTTEINRLKAAIPERGIVVIVDVNDAGMRRMMHSLDGAMQSNPDVPELIVVY